MKNIFVGITGAALLAVIVVCRPAYASTKTLSSLSVPQGASDVVVVGNYAYIAGASGVTVADISNHAAPSIVRTVFVPDTPNHVVVDSSTLYIADTTVVEVMNLADPANPSTYSTITPAHSLTIVSDIAVNGNTLYITVGDNTSREVQKWDVSNKAAPSFVSSVSLYSGASYGTSWMTLSGDYAYVTAGSQFYIINVASMSVVGTYSNSALNLRGIQVYNSVAYINGNGLHTISVANPAAPTLLHDGTDNNHIDNGVAVSNGYVFLTRDTGVLIILDIASTGSPVYVDTLTGSNYGGGVTIANDVAFVANGLVLQLFDVSQPDNVAPVITVTEPGGGTTSTGGGASGGSGSSTLVLNPSSQTFTDPGVTVTDNIGGDITSQLVVTGSVNLKKVGKYVLTYTSTDRAGNSTSVTRTVIVAPTSARIATDKTGYYKLKVGKKVVTLKPFGYFRGTILARKLVLDTTSNPYYFFITLGATSRPKAALYSSTGKLVSSQDLRKIGTGGFKLDMVSDPKNLAMMISVAPSSTVKKVNVYTVSPKGMKPAGEVTVSSKSTAFVMKLLKYYNNEMALGTMVKGKPSTIKIWRYNSRVKQFVWDKKYDKTLLKLTGTSITLKK